MIEAPGWISCEVAGRSVVRSSRRVRIAGSGFGTCFRSFGFEFQGPCSAFTSWEVGREGEVARLKWSKFFGHIHDSTLIVGRSSIARASRSFQRLHWLKRASTEVTAMVQIRPRRTEQQQGIGRLSWRQRGGGAPSRGFLLPGAPKRMPRRSGAGWTSLSSCTAGEILDPANPSNPQAPISFPSDSLFCRGRLKS